jgi:putative flippase GtrA
MVLDRFLRFSAVGAIGTAAHYATLVLLVQRFHADPVGASAVGFVVGALVNYALNYRFTFASNKRHTEAMTKFFTVALIGLGVNALMMAVLAKLFGLYYLLAQVLTTGAVLIWNFAANHAWTFRE